MRAFIIALSVIALIGCSNQKKVETEETGQAETEKSVKLPGLAPADIYLSLEERGFLTDKQIGGEYGNLWTCKSSSGGIDYTVEIASSGASDVETVRATAMVNRGGPREALPFIQFVSSAPIEGVNREAVQTWIAENFDKDKVSFESGEVRYTIYAPSQMVRMLRIENSSVQE
ncbi:MAG: hypothetical protein JXA28_01630 [Bacteroidetes bacterium]|nr:hypothetical protein [Bacteroidota bacterium]